MKYRLTVEGLFYNGDKCFDVVEVSHFKEDIEQAKINTINDIKETEEYF